MREGAIVAAIGIDVGFVSFIGVVRSCERHWYVLKNLVAGIGRMEDLGRRLEERSRLRVREEAIEAEK